MDRTGNGFPAAIRQITGRVHRDPKTVGGNEYFFTGGTVDPVLGHSGPLVHAYTPDNADNRDYGFRWPSGCRVSPGNRALWCRNKTDTGIERHRTSGRSSATMQR